MAENIQPESREISEDDLEQISGGVGKSKLEKVKLDNQAIDAGMAEAKEKATNQMNAATTALTTGIIGGIIQKSGSQS